MLIRGLVFVVNYPDLSMLRRAVGSTEPGLPWTVPDTQAAHLTASDISCPVTASLSGTLVSSGTEAEIVAGSETLIVTLSNDTWGLDGRGPKTVPTDVGRPP